MAKIIGIDLGTSNTAAAVMEGGRGTIIPSAEGSSIGGKAFPSYVAFTKDGQRLVGEPARRQAIANPEGTVTAFKRKMGENYKFNLRGQEFTPQQLSAFVLQKVKKDAEAFLGEPVEKAIEGGKSHGGIQRPEGGNVDFDNQKCPQDEGSQKSQR